MLILNYWCRVFLLASQHIKCKFALSKKTLMTEFFRKRSANAKNDILSGITVSLAMIPEVVAFAFVKVTRSINRYSCNKSYSDWF